MANTMTKGFENTFSPEKYTVGVVCALPKELFAVRALFDSQHEYSQMVIDRHDSNSYVLGRIGHHNVAAACLPKGEYGTTSASDVATHMIRSFSQIRFCLLVGIGGGVPSRAHDIRLGDVVVSLPTETSSGVIQYDLGKAMQDGTFKLTGTLQRPPRRLLTAISILTSNPHLPPGFLQTYLDQVAALNPSYRNPGQWQDTLYDSTYPHDDSQETCNHCDGLTVNRNPRDLDHPQIFYGIIASGNQVVKSAQMRDRLGEKYKILCFEMEAAGVMNATECLVIRGICDYADSHKNKVWQEYAAAAAAAYAKLLLSFVTPSYSSEIPITSPDKISSLGIAGTTAELSCVTKPPSVPEPPTEYMDYSALIEWVKPAQLPELRLAERKSFARRRQLWNPWPKDAPRLFQSLDRWMSVLSPALFVVEASVASNRRAEDLAFEVVEFLQSKTSYDVVHSLSSPTHHFDPAIDVLKSLLFGCLRKDSKSLLSDFRVCQSQLKACDEETAFEFFRMIAPRLDRCFVVTEAKESRCTERLLELFREVIGTSKHSIKAMVVTYTSHNGLRNHLPNNSLLEIGRILAPPPSSRRNLGGGTGGGLNWGLLKPRFPEPRIEGGSLGNLRKATGKTLVFFDGDEHSVPENSITRSRADDFLSELDDWIKFRYKNLESPEQKQGQRTPRHTKVAILDTGIYLNHPQILAARQDIKFIYRRQDEPIKLVKHFVGNSALDEDGHGTLTTMLLLKSAPQADIYVAKIAADKTSGECDHIAEAINEAVMKWNVDIIVMPFGINGPRGRVEAAINDAYHKKTILIASAANGGSNENRAYPAEDERVICIHATDGKGNDYGGINPSPIPYQDNFATLGLGIKFFWSGKYAYQCGTSFSAPIAAGIAASILDFSKTSVFENKLTEEQREVLGTGEGIKKIFRLLAGDKRQMYDYIAPWNLWKEGLDEFDVCSLIKSQLI